MKKRFIAVIPALSFALALGGCGFFGDRASEAPLPEPSAAGMVTTASLSAEVEETLGLLNVDLEEWEIYDFSAPVGTESMDLTLWELEDGAWKEYALNRVHSEVLGGRAAVRFDLDTLEFSASCQSNKGLTRQTPMRLAEPEEGVSWGVSTLGDACTAQTDEPVALMLITGSGGGSHVLYEPQVGFDEPGLFDGRDVKAFALTIEFRSSTAE